MRESGILFPISSLPSPYGIGCFSKEAYDFVDFLANAGQGFWQILPIGPTGFGDSPYQPFSAFAGNPYFISPVALVEDGLLTYDELNALDFGSDVERVDYGQLYNNRYRMLQMAFDRFVEKKGDATPEYKAFLKEQDFWLEDYCLFMTLKQQKFEGASWENWDEDYRTHKATAIKEAKEEYADTMAFFSFQQFMFDQQWKKLHAYATKKNVKIIGDIPFYVSLDSADVWSHPEAFQMDKEGHPTVVAGCPPDAFSATGQLWGNPIYDWENRKASGYDWWMRRLERSYEFYDVVRIDHFHGFSEYYAIPYGDETAVNGTMCKGPGMDFFDALYKRFGDLTWRMIAEDLGTITEENQKLLKDSKIPGMQVLQYAFTSWDSIYLPHRHIQNSVVYTGTHDNTPLRVWFEEISDGHRDYTRRYLNTNNYDFGALVWDMIREAYRSVCDLCIIPLQDYLVFGREARINSPGTADGNWQWRLRPNFLSDDLARSIRSLAELYGRLPKEKEEK